jgi:hypothetical protein
MRGAGFNRAMVEVVQQGPEGRRIEVRFPALWRALLRFGLTDGTDGLAALELRRRQVQPASAQVLGPFQRRHVASLSFRRRAGLPEFGERGPLLAFLFRQRRALVPGKEKAPKRSHHLPCDPRTFKLTNHRVFDPTVRVKELSPNRVQNGGESRHFRWTHVDGVLTATADCS